MFKNAEWKERADSPLFLFLGLIIVNILWGASSIAGRQALLQLSTIEIVTIRFAIASLFLLILTILWKGISELKVDVKDLPVLAFLSIAGVSLQFVLQLSSINYTTVTNFSLLFNLSTFFIMILGAMLLKERLSNKKLLGAGVAFGGVALIVSGGGLEFSSSHFFGDIIGLSSAAIWAVYTIAAKKVSGKYSLLTIMNYTFILGVAGLIPFYVYMTPMTPLTQVTSASWASILFLAILCSVVAFLIYNQGLSRLKASDVAMTIYITPLSGVLLAALILGESMTLFTLIGAALILAGMYATGERPGAADGRVPVMHGGKAGAETDANG
ncbi:EamA/RhaT family transporter [Methanocella sp. CWC-04]|uniref:EamA/RhaT family transporter n=1 Tax=Methanooceanicella nereidis TaxID=2052831 RepID=A0AAP2W4T1_9EURY|nr:DMT family transporter [Methanocella sp. CWC-04]MCD1294705.1 EamA/RhaT family transporter [Methanocella sp. CWC-04]